MISIFKSFLFNSSNRFRLYSASSTPSAFNSSSFSLFCKRTHPSSPLSSASITSFSSSRSFSSFNPTFNMTSSTPHLPDSIILSQLEVRMLLGVDSWERLQPQPVLIDVKVDTDVSKAGISDHLPYSIHYGVLTKELERHCREQRYRSLEALADGIAKVCIFICHAPRVTITVQKPRSLLHAVSAGVEVIRTSQDFVDQSGSSIASSNLGISPEQLSQFRLSPTSTSAIHDKVMVKDLLISTILGVNPWERVDKQVIKLNLVVYSGLERLRQASITEGEKKNQVLDVVNRPHNYRTIVRSISDYVEESSYKTVESLATSIARVAVLRNRVEKIKVRVDKPSAIMFAKSAGVEVERDRAFFELEAQQDAEANASGRKDEVGKAGVDNVLTSPLLLGAASTNLNSLTVDGLSLNEGSATPSTSAPSSWHIAAIALGSNLGDRANNIEKAVQELSQAEGCRLVDTSFLYETDPMYVMDQPRFLNGACRIATRLEPEELLNLTQSIETKLGRDKTGVPIKGPRVVDLDLIFYDRLELESSRLTIPHPGLKEREFVLLPLADILPHYEHPTALRTVSQLLSVLQNAPDYEPSGIFRVMPVPTPRSSSSISSSAPSSSTQDSNSSWAWGSRTFIMGIINSTPDSFSDGGDHFSLDRAVTSAKQMVKIGADVLDIGGMSTAPSAPEIAVSEEISRTAPLIKALREAGIQTPISIDTFRSQVARSALEAGANLVNDVSGGERDPEMLSVVKEWGCPFILMHMRGDSKTMNKLSKYENGDVVGGVRRELENRVSIALKSGIRRWNIILDPGLGFAKDSTGNIELIRGLASLTNKNFNNINVASTNLTTSVAKPTSRKTSLTSMRESLKDSTVTYSSPSSPNQDPLSPSSSSFNGAQDPHQPSSSLSSFPVLLGPSRKRFLGTITGKSEPKERVYATAAACSAAIAAGVDFLRVHDVEEMKDVSRTCDAIFRGVGEQ